MAKLLGVGVAVGLLVLVVLEAVGVRAGVVESVVPHAAGTSAWSASRALGLVALAALSLDMVFGLALSTRAIDQLPLLGRAGALQLHRTSSTAALSLAAAHALVLGFDGWLRVDVLDVLVPFLHPWQRLGVGVGVLSLWGAVVVHASFWARGALGPKGWRALHTLSFVVFAGAMAHALGVGTDQAALRALVAGSLLALAALATLRLAGEPRRA